MYMNILLVTLFSYLPSISAAALPVECTNYPGYPVGTLIGKPRADKPTSFPTNKQTRWCREASTMYIYFSPPQRVQLAEYGETTEQAFHTALANAIDVLNIIPSTNLAFPVPTDYKLCVFSGGNNTISLYATSTGVFTYGQVIMATKMLQNYFYVTRNYGSLYISVYEGKTNLGVLELE